MSRTVVVRGQWRHAIEGDQGDETWDIPFRQLTHRHQQS
jgi:hypothetical protein